MSFIVVLFKETAGNDLFAGSDQLLCEFAREAQKGRRNFTEATLAHRLDKTSV